MEQNFSASRRGEIITFYSYKGGTGRTMALANVACLLAERAGPQKQVLVIDWDLEAPGLHRFFPPRLVKPSAAFDLGLDATLGLIDLFLSLSEALPPRQAKSEEDSETAVEAALQSVDFDLFIAETEMASVKILRAGGNEDGRYSQRVTKFDWEGLFNRAPTVYRAFAERLSEMFRYVLIDSRTGVTDISGICTSLLPEKLVVVFTPNRQSLGGARQAVETATSYRRKSDDLRPLLVYPLPSRIEASVENLREFWRFGSRDQNIVGYQPMFEELLAQVYGMEHCDLSAYFEQVYLQQTPDYAYGEEIAVRRASDRLSLASSYRVFVDHLLSSNPPWAGEAAATEGAGSLPLPLSPTWRAKPAPIHDVSQESRLKVFLSYARENRERVMQLANALESSGCEVWRDRTTSPGIEYERTVTDALDTSDVVVVFWSRMSVASEAVLAEAKEGLRRGILIPVLLDDVVPPLGFREVQSADLRRDSSESLAKLVDAVKRVARGSPGTVTPPAAYRVEAVPPSKGAPRGPYILVAVVGAMLGLVLVFSGIALYRSMRGTPLPTRVEATPIAEVRVPSFVGSTTSDVQKGAEFLALKIEFVDSRGSESASPEGVIVKQSPPPGQQVAKGALIKLQVETRTVAVPLVAGMTLDQAVVQLTEGQLRLGTTTTQATNAVKAGTIVSQSPLAGTKVAAGNAVDVVVAAPSKGYSRTNGLRGTPAPATP
jgi:TIR domain/PASTA domain